MWDERYSESGFAYGTEPNDFLKIEYPRIPAGGRVLCLAEGEGRNAVFLAQQGYRVTAVDQSAVGLQKAGRLATEFGVDLETVVADLDEFPIGEDCWDGIVSIAAHMPADLRRRIHRSVVAGLKPGAVFILEAYTLKQLEMPGLGGPPPSSPDLFMSLTDLHDELAGLFVELGQELERELSEGKYHRGLSAVVQLVASKGITS